MNKHDCMFVSRNEDFDTSSTMGRAMMGILAVFAQMERENIQTRIKDNYDYRVRDGRWASGKAPFGFKNGKIDGKTTLIPVQEEIEMVKQIEFANDLSMWNGEFSAGIVLSKRHRCYKDR